MKILFTSLKGGVGKSSLALSLANYRNAACITNDISITDHTRCMQIPHTRKRIPGKYLSYDELVLDFGAMSTSIDPKLTQATKLCDVFVVPTLTDDRSLLATVKTYELLLPAGKPILIIINNFSKQKHFEYATQFLNTALENPHISSVRTTTLFQRIARDGESWFSQIRHNKGEYQLKRTMKKHEEIFDYIAMLGALS